MSTSLQHGRLMIEEPRGLVFAPAVEPPPGVRDKLRGAPTSFIAHATGGSGVLDWRIMPLVRASTFGVAIAPGDLVVGDRDGVVAFARARLEDTLAGREPPEAALLENVRGGLQELRVRGARQPKGVEA